MAQPLDVVAAALRKIRDQADWALLQINEAGERRSLSWRCTQCGYVKKFTRPASEEVATSRCPRCRGEQFEPGQ